MLILRKGCCRCFFEASVFVSKSKEVDLINRIKFEYFHKMVIEVINHQKKSQGQDIG